VLRADLKSELPSQIDSGNMGTGNMQIRTKFTIDPVGSDSLLSVDMPKGAVVQASWSEKGYIDVKTVTQPNVQGTMNAHFTLRPSLSASIYGFGVNYDATQLVNKIPGASFHYDAKASTPILPWGFGGAALSVPAPSLDSSTIFSIPFSDLGVDTGLVEGSLSIQAAAKPTFNYVTKNVRLDSGTITKADGTAKIAIGDEDFLDLSASIDGELTLGGTLDIRPVVKVDTVDGYPTFGLVKYSFSAVSKPIGDGKPMAVSFGNTSIHIPLPNVKVPSTPVSLGAVKPGSQAEQTITIDSTGEMAGKLRFSSSDPQFIVPTEEVRVDSKTKYALKVVFKPTSDSGASATITVKSNDPDSPEQTFRVAANGASLGGPDGKDDGPVGQMQGGVSQLDAPPNDSGCSFAAKSNGSKGGWAAVMVALGLAAAARRRKSC
jgi:MYXO-CTERM domain-containing protein